MKKEIKVPVYMAVVEMAGTTDIFLASSADKLNAHLCDSLIERWDVEEDGPIPADPEALIRLYFTIHDDQYLVLFDPGELDAEVDCG